MHPGLCSLVRGSAQDSSPGSQGPRGYATSLGPPWAVLEPP